MNGSVIKKVKCQICQWKKNLLILDLLASPTIEQLAVAPSTTPTIKLLATLNSNSAGMEGYGFSRGPKIQCDSETSIAKTTKKRFLIRFFGRFQF